MRVGLKRAGLMMALVTMCIAPWGCAGLAFYKRDVPNAVFYAETSTNEQVTQNKLGEKHGEACAMSVLGWVTVGDASVSAAAKQGGISTVASVDQTFMNVLGIFARYCAVVSGE